MISSPAFTAASGVAPDTASATVRKVLSGTVKSHIFPAKEISRKHLAPRAGFIKFSPRPPNSIFTIIIAKAEPRIGIHHGTPTGRFMPSKSPVTTALKSPMDSGLCRILSIMASKKQAEAMDNARISRALGPKLKIPKTAAGAKAATTIFIR